MGLDGISVNQLRITPEKNSAEAASIAKFSLSNEVKVVDGLSEGQKVDPDKQNDKEKQQLEQNFTSGDEDEDENFQEEIQEEVIKYDLSRKDKYALQLDEENNTIVIIDKITKNVIQKIDPQELSLFVNYLSNSQGSMINRRF